MRSVVVVAVLSAVLVAAAPAAGASFAGPGAARERVVSSPFTAGGYPGAKPAPGSCESLPYDSNFSESALAVRPGSERLVGAAKAYFNRWSTFKAYHTAAFAFGAGLGATTHVIGGFDCATTGTQEMPPSWTNVTDPNVAWDRRGRVHGLALAFNAYWGSVKQPNGDVVAIHSDDGGRTWVKGNGGRPVQAGPKPSTEALTYLDKPWIAVNTVEGHKWANHVYGVWVQFNEDEKQPAEIRTAVSRDRGATWSAPVPVKPPVALEVSTNPWPQIAVGADGTVHLTFVTYGPRPESGNFKVSAATVWSARSTDDGRTWGTFRQVAGTRVIRSCCLPRTSVHDGVVEFMDAARDRPGHVYVTYERVRRGQVDVMLAASRDGGRTWGRPVRVEDDRRGFDQFQPEVAAGPGGAVAVAFYDKRARCPRDASVVAANRGRRDRCLVAALQAFRDGRAGLRRLGGNVRVSRHPWDPQQPAGKRGGIGQLACEDAEDPCQEIFIGDYFGLAVSRTRVHVLSASTHYPSRVRGDDGRRLHYQQQVLATVPRRALGLGVARRR